MRTIGSIAAMLFLLGCGAEETFDHHLKDGKGDSKGVLGGMEHDLLSLEPSQTRRVVIPLTSVTGVATIRVHVGVLEGGQALAWREVDGKGSAQTIGDTHFDFAPEGKEVVVVLENTGDNTLVVFYAARNVDNCELQDGSVLLAGRVSSVLGGLGHVPISVQATHDECLGRPAKTKQSETDGTFSLGFVPKHVGVTVVHAGKPFTKNFDLSTIHKRFFQFIVDEQNSSLSMEGLDDLYD